MSTSIKLNRDQIRTIREMLAQGKSYSDIHKVTGISNAKIAGVKFGRIKMRATPKSKAPRRAPTAQPTSLTEAVTRLERLALGLLDRLEVLKKRESEATRPEHLAAQLRRMADNLAAPAITRAQVLLDEGASVNGVPAHARSSLE